MWLPTRALRKADSTRARFTFVSASTAANTGSNDLAARDTYAKAAASAHVP